MRQIVFTFSEGSSAWKQAKGSETRQGDVRLGRHTERKNTQLIHHGETPTLCAVFWRGWNKNGTEVKVVGAQVELFGPYWNALCHHCLTKYIDKMFWKRRPTLGLNLYSPACHRSGVNSHLFVGLDGQAVGFCLYNMQLPLGSTHD